MTEAAKSTAGETQRALSKVPAQSIAQGVTQAIAGLTGSSLKALAQGPGQIAHALSGVEHAGGQRADLSCQQFLQ